MGLSLSFTKQILTLTQPIKTTSSSLLCYVISRTRDVEYTSNQFAKLSNSLQTLSKSSEAWEKESGGLRANGGKAMIKQSIDSVNKAMESSKKTLVMFAKVDDKILSKESGGSKKNEIVETDKLVKESLLVTFNKLSKAEQQGRTTERLLRDASAQGDKEAKM